MDENLLSDIDPSFGSGSGTFIGTPSITGTSDFSNGLVSQTAGALGVDSGLATSLQQLSNSVSPLAASITSASTATTPGLTDLFLRGVVIILGFIFIAVGLSMFKQPIIEKVIGK